VPVALSYVSFLSDAGAEDAEEKLIEQFETIYPHLTINASQFQRAPLAYLADQSPPDLMTASADADTMAAAAAGQVLDISDLWSQPGLKESYIPSFLTLGQLNGKQYFLPVGFTWTALYYNREIFDAYNLTPPQTWDEFLAVADTLLANGVTPITLAGQDLWALTTWFDYLNLRLNGADFREGLIRGQESYDDVRVRDAFDTWRFLLDSGYFIERSYLQGQLKSVTQVGTGDAAMVLANPFNLSELPAALRDKLDYFPFPQMNPNVPLGEITPTFGYVIPANTAHPTEAMMFLTFMASKEGQLAMSEQLSARVGILPVYGDVDSQTLPVTAQAGYNLIRAVDYVGQPYIFTLSAQTTAPTDQAFRQFLQDPATLDEVIADLADIYQTE
jgi:ABC-type glycerol-3-phosphate transport system substrate-binding protein